MAEKSELRDWKRALKSTIGLCLGAGLFLFAFGPAQRASAQTGDELDVLQLRPNFYMIAGAGGNIAVQTGPDGIVLVNAGSQAASDRVLAAIKKLSDRPIIYIIDTSADADLVGGNANLAKAGRSIFAAGTTPIGGDAARDATGGFAASIIAQENVLLRMSAPTGKAAPFPLAAWPVESFNDPRRYIYMNHEGIEMFHQPAAHSDGDLLVFFRASDIVVAGDVLDSTRFPVIDIEKGGSVQGEIDALNRLIDLAVRPIPFVFEEGGTFIVPGHGRVFEQSDVVEYRDMVVIVRDVIQDMIKRGMTLGQIKEASPAKPFESQYGSASGPWTTNDFVEAIYKSLTAKK
jgi:glyoxylase-like metal-dependent hydrolase (beta-lactamase superfamily II)